MPRRNRTEDLDFEIHVDPSCLSDPMDDNDNKAPEEPKVEVKTDHDTKNDSVKDLDTDIDTTSHTDSTVETKAEPTAEAKDEDKSAATPEDTEDTEEDKAQPNPEAAEPEAKSKVEPEPEAEPKDEAEAQVDAELKPEEPIEESESESESDSEEKEDETVQPAAEAEADTSAELDDTKDNEKEQPTTVEDVTTTEDTTPIEDAPSDIPTEDIPVEDSTAQDPKEDEHTEEDKAKTAEAEVEDPAEADERHFSESESDHSGSRRVSSGSSGSSGSRYSDHRHSGRSEALRGVARDITSQIDNHEKRESFGSYAGTDDTGYISHSESVSTRKSPNMSTAGMRGGVDEAAENSSHHGSHHEHEDDVFSDRSPRSSMGSVSETDQRKAQGAMNRMTRSPRVSGVSGISGLSEYDRDDEDFIPTIRGNPRPVFRSPSSVKAMQMTSPPGSTIGSPRSSRRAPLSASRLGSPRFSEQYSPKKTPPRFKRSTPPLVLLHVTLLPLRWPWGDVLENADADDLSKECKAIRDAWRLLQDRMGDTTVERGILLPHPQNDYEVLEERLLDALELPMRRRARILECGHYLGPSNEMTIEDSEEGSSEEDYDDEDYEKRRSSRHSQRQPSHWCKTCKSDINYESLGREKVFRVKVYASNGLIRGGAWEACWKEMERVDVELEPLVDAVSQHELVSLEADQERELAMREAEEEERYIRLDEEQREFEERERGRLSRRRGESRNHVEEDMSHLSEGKSRMEDHDASHLDASRQDESHYDKSLAAESVREKSVHDKSLHEPSHHDESLRDISEVHEASTHDATKEHEESHIANDTQPADEHSADVTKESIKEPAENAEESFAVDADVDKSRSFEELEKDIDDHLQEERERSLAEEARSAEPSHVEDTHLEAEESSIAPEEPSIAPDYPADSKAEDEELLRRDEERLREIYGDVPTASEKHHRESQRAFHEQQPQHHEQHYAERSNPSNTHAPGYGHAAPREPSAEERRRAMKNATLGELLAESARVAVQDKKNILIGLLSVLILLLAIRGGPGPQQDPRTFQTVVRNVEIPTVTVTHAISVPTSSYKQIGAVEEESKPEADIPKENVVVEDTPEEKDAEKYLTIDDKAMVAGSSSSGSVDPCASCAAPSYGDDAAEEGLRQIEAAPDVEPAESEKEAVCSERIVRVVETVTAVETATVKVTEYPTDLPSQWIEVVDEEEGQAEESVAPKAEDVKEDPEAPADKEASSEESSSVGETILPSEEAKPVEEEGRPSQETQSPEESLGGVEQQADAAEPSIEVPSESAAPEALGSNEEAPKEVAEHSEEADEL
ncbi:hypothetical protein F53441_6689 [Fusarium austroafricanum]|uniref:Pathway-specific nitrogen regulator n=1 Tax=Fusarium austroafricanum TaxID=2364996 RepID=A0A8H4KGS7_9HYPO|nr:hypothetical protein F53441_6689 [Fusarium austroafricanum]